MERVDRPREPANRIDADRDDRRDTHRTPETGSRRRAEDIGETWPELPDWATPDALDVDARRDLRGLSKENAAWVAAHLVAASTLADEEPETAWWHARAARARGGRIAVVRETVGLVAYRAGQWAEAIGELRAARRMGGGPGHLAILADCERALGHPEKAIELSRSKQAEDLDDEGRIELATVVAGARADLGQVEAGLAHIEQFGSSRIGEHPRLAYAYADLLDRAGRTPEALTWFIRAANADVDEGTDALERIESLAASVGAPVDTVSDAEAPAARPAPAPEDETGPEPTGDHEPGPDESGSRDEPASRADTADPEPTIDNDSDDNDDDNNDNNDNDNNDNKGDGAPTEPVADATAVLFSDDPQTGDR